MSFNGAQKPRIPPSGIHQLPDFVEEIYQPQHRQMLNNFKAPGKQCNPNSINVGTRQFKIPQACLVITHQLAIPPDNPDYPIVRKLNTRFDSIEHVPVYGVNPNAKWEEDHSFVYVPKHSRYVCNREGLMLNATNRSVVSKNAFIGSTAIFSDGRGTNPPKRPTEGSMIEMLVKGAFPSGFTHYGFNSVSHEFGLCVDGTAGWRPLPKVTVRDMTTGDEVEEDNIYEYLECHQRDFNAKNTVRSAYYDMDYKHVRIQYTPQQGRATDIELCFSAAKGLVDKNQPAVSAEYAPVQTSHVTDSDLGF